MSDIIKEGMARLERLSGVTHNRKRVDVVMASGIRGAVMAHVFAGRGGLWAAHEAGSRISGWRISRLPDGHELIAGLDREVACDICRQMAGIAGGKLADFQAVLRRYLGSFAL